MKSGNLPSANGGNAGNRPNAGSNGNTNRPNVAGSVPANGVTRPANSANTNRPSNGNQGETNNKKNSLLIIFIHFLGIVNIPLQQIIGSASNQRVKKPASTTRRIVTTIRRQSATARSTTRKN